MVDDHVLHRSALIHRLIEGPTAVLVGHVPHHHSGTARWQRGHDGAHCDGGGRHGDRGGDGIAPSVVVTMNVVVVVHVDIHVAVDVEVSVVVHVDVAIEVPVVVDVAIGAARGRVHA